MLPFTIAPETPFDYESGDWIYIPGIREAVRSGADSMAAKVLHGGTVTDIELQLTGLTAEDREILLAGCLMNWYKNGKKGEI
jgi:aconitate hydratase